MTAKDSGAFPGAGGSGFDAPQPPESNGGVGNPPSISLPKSGGAIRGIGEKFAANPVTGSGSMTVPVYTSPGRAGFGPQLSLSYDSGSGNGPLGFGWNLALPSITRKTDKGLPQYDDSIASDDFILSGAEDLAPALVQTGSGWTGDIVPSRRIFGTPYTVQRYRPRVESLYARIERWTNLEDHRDCFWRTISRDNVTTWYGKTPESRIADPNDPSRIYSWLICESYNDKGSVIAYRYKAEDSDGIDLSLANEHNRSELMRSAQRYIRHIYYGNRTPYYPDLTRPAPAPLPDDWCFEVVFDYGEHHLIDPRPDDAGQWHCRLDAFSTYRSTFEVRTYRLCRRVLMFHHFAEEANIGLNCLVRSTDLRHTTPPVNPARPFYSFLLSVAQTGYTRASATSYVSKSLPPVEFEYSEAVVDDTVRDLDASSLENLPSGVDGSNYRWVDLNGEGMSGVLSEQGGSWFYKSNLSPTNQQEVDGAELTLPKFAPVEVVAQVPSLAHLNGGIQQLMDLAGDGDLDLVDFEAKPPGFFARTSDGGWDPFTPLPSLPAINWHDPNLRFIDLSGDGLPDLLITEHEAFCWHASMGSDGFGAEQRVARVFDEEQGPALVFSDVTESIFLADMSGDGLTDLVRIRNGEVCYWPNIGYGRFGPKVAMDASPWFEPADLFDSRRVRLVDIDGTGTADIIYFAGRAVHLYFNQSGGAWGARRILNSLPPVESVSSCAAVDLLGNGTACLVWSSPLASHAGRPMRYIDLMGDKPHLLTAVRNNLGAETAVKYAPSTKFYVADKLAGKPWVTRLPFPVHVVEEVRSYDYIGRNLFVSRYSYHHGYFDPGEREFRGFGRVDQVDTAAFAALTASSDLPAPRNLAASSSVPPVCTKTWFHTGAFIDVETISKFYEREYYSEGDESENIPGLTAEQASAMRLDDTVLPSTILLPDGNRLDYDLSVEEMRQACRALRGLLLRQEIFAQDGTVAADRPYTVAERNYTIETLQPKHSNRVGVFAVHPRESITFQYERALYTVAGDSIVDPNTPGARVGADPRVAHTVILKGDTFGNALESASVVYGRRYGDPALTAGDRSKQRALLTTYSENRYTNAVAEDDAYHAPLPAEVSAFELLQVRASATVPDITNLVRFDQFQSIIASAADGRHDVSTENVDPAGLNPGEPYRRLLGRSRNLYRPDDLGASSSDPTALLPLGRLEPLALPGCSFRLALTTPLVSHVYQRGGTPLLPDVAGVLGSRLGDGGGYVDLDQDGQTWWIPSTRVHYADAGADPAQELAQARSACFLPRRFEDPFGHTTSIAYDLHLLIPIEVRDALDNATSATHNYRVLQPQLITDANGNRTAASFDALGLVVATAVMGKTSEDLGDTLESLTADLSAQQVDQFFALDDPHPMADALLGGATTRIVYDVNRFRNSRAAAPSDPDQWQPTCAATLAREKHVSDLSVGETTKIQISFTYSDGSGTEIQKKFQAEPETGSQTIRWLGSGWTIFDNKGNAVRRYEPFFSTTCRFEFAKTVGISPIICYDPLSRPVATILPDHSYEKAVIDPWRLERWDGNDTVLHADPATDPDAGGFFRRLPASEYLPTWHQQRTTGTPGEQDAASKTAAHANTPAVLFFDPLGRAFLTIADNAAGGKYATRIEFDIEGRQRSVVDPLDRTVVKFQYDITGSRIHQDSMEAGERWMLNDVLGKLIRNWDTRGHIHRTAYDDLRRRIGSFVAGTDPVHSDPRTLGSEILYETIEYGEGQPDDRALNLRTRVYRTRDCAGVVEVSAYDFKANLLRSTRQFLKDYKSLPDWSVQSPPPLQNAPPFTASSQFDALNRVVTTVAADGSVYLPAYNEGNLLERVAVQLSAAATATAFVTNIDYNARGQRTRIDYANQASTSYTYDPARFRLIRLATTRDGVQPGQETLQDLTYTLDPAGNVTHLEDAAQDVVFFSNSIVDATNDYTYDPLYRLIEARGREHLGQNAGRQPTSYNDMPRVNLPHPGDGQAMARYTDNYRYDDAGNIREYHHIVHSALNAGWTRTYAYTDSSLLEPGKDSNRLSKTVLAGAQPFEEVYAYDAHGNMIRMPQLQAMQWDCKDQLSLTRRQAVNSEDTDGDAHQGERTFYVYDSAGRRVRKVTEGQNGTVLKEWLYVDGLDIERKYDPSGTVTLERQSLHVMDDKQRIALVEARVQGGSPGHPAIRYQFGNHLGSALLELDERAQIISYEEYYPYGSTSYQAVRAGTETGSKRYRYNALERDEETGLSYHSARYYAPWLGRWTAVDPEGIMGGLNIYEYARSNPLVYIDPAGAEPEPYHKMPGWSGNEPWRYFIGRMAHDFIGRQYRAKYFTEQSSIFLNYVDIAAILTSSGGDPSLLTQKQRDMKPDITNTKVREVYEIKPRSSQQIEVGMRQVQQYKSALEQGEGGKYVLGGYDEGVQGRAVLKFKGGRYVYKLQWWTVYYDKSSETMSLNPSMGLPETGVIVYTIERLNPKKQTKEGYEEAARKDMWVEASDAELAEQASAIEQTYNEWKAHTATVDKWSNRLSTYENVVDLPMDMAGNVLMGLMSAQIAGSKPTSPQPTVPISPTVPVAPTVPSPMFPPTTPPYAPITPPWMIPPPAGSPMIQPHVR